LGIIFVSHRKAEVDQETIAKELGDMPIVALDNVGTHPLICMHYVTPVFWVELAGKTSGVHQVTEHDRELSTFRVRRYSLERCDLQGGLFLHTRLWGWLSRLRGYGRGFYSGPSPHEYSAIFIRRELLCLDDLRLECFEILIIQAEPYLEGWVGNSPLPF